MCTILLIQPKKSISATRRKSASYLEKMHSSGEWEQLRWRRSALRDRNTKGVVSELPLTRQGLCKESARPVPGRRLTKQSPCAHCNCRPWQKLVTKFAHVNLFYTLTGENRPREGHGRRNRRELDPVVSGAVILPQHFRGVVELAFLVDPPGVGHPASGLESPAKAVVFAQESGKKHKNDDEQDRLHDHPRHEAVSNDVPGLGVISAFWGWNFNCPRAMTTNLGGIIPPAAWMVAAVRGWGAACAAARVLTRNGHRVFWAGCRLLPGSRRLPASGSACA